MIVTVEPSAAVARPSRTIATAWLAATAGSAWMAPERRLEPERPVGLVGPISERLGPGIETRCRAGVEQDRAGKPDEHHVARPAPDGAGDRLCDGEVDRSAVVHGAVGFDVPQLGTLRPGERGDRADLVQNAGLELVRRHVEVTAPEAGEVGVARVSPDRDAGRYGPPHGLLDDGRVAGVEPAGDVDRADERDQLLVGPNPPGTEALADDRCSGRPTCRRRYAVSGHSVTFGTSDGRPARPCWTLGSA